MDFFRKISFEQTVAFGKDGALRIGKKLYGTIDFISKKFECSKELTEKILHPYIHDVICVYAISGSDQLPYFLIREVRSIFARHGVERVKERKNRKRAGRWEIQEKKSKRSQKTTVFKDDITKVVDGKFFARAVYWANLFGVRKCSITNALDQLDNLKATGDIIEFSPMTEVRGKHRKNRSTRTRFCNHKVAQMLADQNPLVSVDDSTEDREVRDELATAPEWKMRFGKPENLSSHGKSIALSNIFFRTLKQEYPSYLIVRESIRLRAYTMQDAHQAFIQAIDVLEKSKQS